MLAKRIIPCLDVRNGKVVMGVNFQGIQDVGDPVECAAEYNRQGADELVFYDITASHEGRGVILDVVRRAAQQVFVPLTVGGGISTIDDFRETLRAGADKVSINSSAVKNPKLIAEAADFRQSVRSGGRGCKAEWHWRLHGVCKRRADRYAPGSDPVGQGDPAPGGRGDLSQLH